MSEMTQVERLQASEALIHRWGQFNLSTEGKAQEADIRRQLDEDYAVVTIPQLDGSNRGRVIRAVSKDIRLREYVYVLDGGTLARGSCNHA